jgi:outer membrane lipoprotein-sorting protein
MLCACVLAASGVAQATDDDALWSPESSADELAARWFDQMFGFDAMEAYEARSNTQRVEFVVLRKWSGPAAELLIDLRAPRAVSSWAYLFRHNPGRPDDLFIYSSGLRRVRRIPPPRMFFPLPFFGAAVSVLNFRPFLPGELHYERLPDESIRGELCYVLALRPASAALGYDRVELAISTGTGVALRERYFRNGSESLRVRVHPEEARKYEDRWLPAQRRIQSLPSGPDVELTLRNLMIHPDLPDRLFTEHNLRVQRFPSF